MIVIGMDISKGVATCTLLEELPQNLSEFARSEEFVYWHIKPCAEDLAAVVALAPGMVVYEPSGGKYEKAFINYLRKHGIKCQKVAGRRLAIYRAEKGLPKNDHFDALAIAAYGIEKEHVPGAFVPPTTPEIEHLRELWLQRFSLVRQRSAMIARVRQRLAYEFPEAMEFDSQTNWGGAIAGLLLWLNGEATGRAAVLWQNKYSGGVVKRGNRKVEIPGTIGSGISPYTRTVVAQLIDIMKAISAIEAEIDRILSKEVYRPYVRAMAGVGLNSAVQAIWLTRIYPFDKFLDEGKERISRRLSTNGRPCTHNQSLSQFKAALGAAVDVPMSGMTGIAPTKKKWGGRKRQTDKVPIGCKYSRIAFFQWVSMRIETGKITGELPGQLIARRHQLKAKGKNIFQRSGNLHGHACKLVYRQLKRDLMKSCLT